MFPSPSTMSGSNRGIAMANEDLLRRYDLEDEGISLRDVMRRLNQIDEARSRLMQGEGTFTSNLRTRWGPTAKAAGNAQARAFAGTLASLDKERAALMRLMADIQRNRLLARKTALDIEARNLPYQLAMQQQTREQNRKIFENLVRHAAGLNEDAPLPPITQKYYAESLVDPQRAANSVIRDLAVARMQDEWPNTVEKVAAEMRRQLGRPLNEQERLALAKGDLRTIVEGNQLLNTESYQKLREIPVGGTVDVSPVHMFVHGYREMRDTDGRSFWGKYERTPDGKVNLIKLTPTETGLVREKTGFGQFIPGQQVPGEIFTGKDVGATPVQGGMPGLFQGPDGRYFYRTYTGIGGGVVKQDIPIHQVQTVSIADLLKPAMVAQAGLTFQGGPNEPPPEAKAYMILDALNKANLAQGKQVAYALAPDESAKAKAAFQAYTEGLRAYGEGLLRGQPPSAVVGQPPIIGPGQPPPSPQGMPPMTGPGQPPRSLPGVPPVIAPGQAPGPAQTIEGSLRESLIRTRQGELAPVMAPEAQQTSAAGPLSGLRSLRTKIFGTPENWEQITSTPTALPAFAGAPPMREESEGSAPIGQGTPTPSLGTPPLIEPISGERMPTRAPVSNLSLRKRLLENLYPYDVSSYQVG